MSRRRATDRLAGVDDTEAAALDHLHAMQLEADAAVVAIAATARLLDELAETAQRGLGFASYEAKRTAGRQYAQDRHDRQIADQLGQAHGTGPVPTPGSWSGMVAEVELSIVLRDLIRRCHRALNAFGVCSLMRVDANATPLALATTLRTLVWDLTHPAFSRLVTQIAADLTAAQADADRFIDGNDRMALGDCPWCHRPSLVVYPREHLVTCDKDRLSGRYAPCVCNDPLCGCKVDAAAHRHTWLREKGTAVDGWYTLARLLNPDAVADRLSLARVINLRS